MLYSARENYIEHDLGNKLYQAAIVNMSLTGLAFDVEVSMLVGRSPTLVDRTNKTSDMTNSSTVCKHPEAAKTLKDKPTAEARRHGGKAKPFDGHF